jgi:hypothetical protein
MPPEQRTKSIATPVSSDSATPSPRGRDLVRAGAQRLRRLQAHVVARVADVERRRDLARDDVRRAGVGGQAPDGREQPRLLARDLLDLQHPLGGGAQRVAPIGHRHRPGVAGDTLEARLGAGGTDDRVDNADRQARPLQLAALLRGDR